MSVASVREYLTRWGKNGGVREFGASSATVELAAACLGVAPGRIAKTLSFYAGPETALLLVAAGDTRVDNAKFKAAFGFKGRMLGPADVERLTGHPPGGVCPFANPPGAQVYLDVSLKAFPTVFPACGSGNSGIELTCEELCAISGARGWVEVCKPRPADAG